MSSNVANEQTLIGKAKKDIREFAPLYEKYYTPIFRFVYNRLEDRQQAEDITSSVFIKAMTSLSKYEFRGFNISSWLYKIALNEVSLYYRSKKIESKYFVEASQLQEFSDEIFEDESVEKILCDCLEFLPNEDFELIQMKYFDGLTFKEIAEIFNKSEDSLKVKMHRVRKNLKNEILKVSHQKGVELLFDLFVVLYLIFEL